MTQQASSPTLSVPDPALRRAWVFVILLLAGAWLWWAAAAGLDGPLWLLGATAFLLGMRHGLDADHIAAIDNVTRRLMGADDARGRRGGAGTTGLWFSVGHSTVVLAAVVLLLAGSRSLREQLGDEDSALGRFTGVWGPSVSAVFLVGIAAWNVVLLLRRERGGRGDPAERGDGVGRGGRPGPARGPAGAIFGPLLSGIGSARGMYPVGLLFGLGFDTAASVGLMVISAQAAEGASWQAALGLPLLFTAGMACCDLADSTIVRRAYGWALEAPARRRAYDATVTLISAAAALLVAAVTAAELAADADLPVPRLLAGIDVEYVGVGLLVLSVLGCAVYLPRLVRRLSALRSGRVTGSPGAR